MESYQYSALQRSPAHIRLLTVEPGEIDDNVKCTMRHVPLENCPSYEAVSYTWGNSAEKRPIYIDDHKLEIMPSLASALRHLRYECGDDRGGRVLWADAVCINQEDLEERGNQVGMMREIYRRARRALVWLGTDDEPEDKQLNGRFVWDKEKPGFIYPPGSEESTWLAVNFAAQLAKCEMEGDNYSSLDHRIGFPEAMGWLALARFFHRGWFRRLWIVQEVAMASDVMGVIGGITFSWVAFMQAAQHIRLHGPRYFNNNWIFTQMGATAVGRANICCGYAKSHDDDTDNSVFKPQATLLSLIYITRTQHCLDPRDRIYAVLGLASDVDHSSLVPDYTKSTEALYKELARHLVTRDSNLDVLCACSYRNRSGKLPSWCPEWDREWGGDPRLIADVFAQESLNYTGRAWSNGPTDKFGDRNIRYNVKVIRHRTAGDSKAIAYFSDTSQTLTVRGMEIDEIAVLCTINRARNRQTPPEQGDEIQDILFGWLHAFMMHPGPVAQYGSRAYDAFCRTLIRNRVEDSRGALVLPSDEYLNMVAIFYKHAQPPAGFVPKTENGRFEYIMSFVLDMLDGAYGCRLFITATGYLGMVHESLGAEVGDKVCVFRGGPTPFVLRQDGASYFLRGAAYVHGLMDGAVMEEIEGGRLTEQDFELR